MKYRLMGPWPAAHNRWIEGGTVIDLEDPEYAGLPAPLNSICLDNEAADELFRLYPHCEAQIQLAEGVTGWELMIYRTAQASAQERNESDQLHAEVVEILRQHEERQRQRGEGE